MIYEFMATQDLHGYGKPWAPGEGINKIEPDDTDLPYSKYGVTVTKDSERIYNVEASSASGYPYAKIGVIHGLAAGDYYLTFNSSNAAVDVRIIDRVSSPAITIKDKVGSFTIEDDIATDLAVEITVDATALDDGRYTISDIQVEAGSTATAWEPYANICPPEGYNIWDPSNDKFIQVYAGYVNANTRELYLRPVYEEYAGEELVGPWMSSLDEYSEDTTPTEGAFVIDFGGELTSYEITPFMLQTLLDSLGIRQHFTDGAGLLNKLMDQAQGRVRSEEELLHLSRPLKVIAIGDQLPAGLTFKPISKDVLPGLPGKFIR